MVGVMGRCCTPSQPSAARDTTIRRMPAGSRAQSLGGRANLCSEPSRARVAAKTRVRAYT